MEIRYIIFCFFFLTFVGFASANFVCGDVIGSDDLSPTWMDVLISYDSHPGDILSCTVSGEHKFCCALEDITSVSWSPGMIVSAEVYDLSSGYSSNKVSLVTSEEAYDVFSPLVISPVINYSSPVQKIMLDDSVQSFNLSLHPRYPNLRVSITNESYFFEETICLNCTEASFDLSFPSGVYNLSFIAFGEREFVQQFTIYHLDYLQVSHKFNCDGCKENPNRVFVPANSIVDVTLTINSSHPLFLDVREFIPNDWVLIGEDDIVLFSESHQFNRFLINDFFFEGSYVVRTPNNLLQKKYTFQTEIENFMSFQDVYIKRLFWFGLPIYFTESFVNNTLYSFGMRQQVDSGEPLILFLNQSFLETVAIYSNRPGMYVALIDISEPTFFSDETTYTFRSSFSPEDVDYIYLQFKVPKGESIELYQNNTNILLDYYKEDDTFLYYRAYINSMEPFYTIDV